MKVFDINHSNKLRDKNGNAVGHKPLKIHELFLSLIDRFKQKPNN